MCEVRWNEVKTMDPIAEYNKRRWAALVQANAVFTRPQLDLDEAAARARVDPEGRLGDVRGKRVLCLASGGGQQSVGYPLWRPYADGAEIS
jgi:hypothetical protein